MKKIISAILSLVIVLTASAFVSFAEDPMTISVSVPEITEKDEHVTTGFDVAINVSGIPACGVSGIKITLDYDSSLEVMGTAIGAGPGENQFGPVTADEGGIAGKLNYAWVAGTESMTADFTLCTVTFKLPEDAKAGDTWSFSLTVEEDDVFDIDLNNVPFTAADAVAVVTESKGLPGDANDDGNVNAKDASVIAKLLAGWNITLNMDNADANADGNVNAKDLSLILKKLAGWDVTLG